MILATFVVPTVGEGRGMIADIFCLALSFERGKLYTNYEVGTKEIEIEG